METQSYVVHWLSINLGIANVRVQVAVIFTAIAASVILVFVAAQITLYSPTKELDDDDDNGD